jgi:putative ABC transport system permease protein
MTTTPPSPARLSLPDMLGLGAVGMRTRPIRAALSALGIGIGIAAMIAVLAIPASSGKAVHDKIAALGTNLLVAAPGQTLTGDKAVLPTEAIPMAKRIAPVTAVSATGAISQPVFRNDRIDPLETSGLAVLAARNDILAVLGGRVVDGEFLDAATQALPTVVLGSVAATRLGVDHVDTAHPQQLLIGQQWFSVIGVLGSMPLAPEVERAVLVGWDAGQEFLGFSGHATRVYLRAGEPQIDGVRAVLAQTLNPRAPNEVDVSRPSDALAAQQITDAAYSSLFLGLGGVALLVGGIGVANTMVVSVLERRREIGLRRALGATKRQIRGQFLAESVLLSGAGGVSGVFVGVLVTSGYSLSQGWPAVLPVGTLVGGVAVSALVGAVAGAYPAIRAARLPPTQALG